MTKGQGSRENCYHNFDLGESMEACLTFFRKKSSLTQLTLKILQFSMEEERKRESFTSPPKFLAEKGK